MKALTFFVILFSFGSAFAAPSFDELSKTCRTDWHAYSAQLNQLHEELLTKVRDLSQRQVEALIDKNDPQMLFVKIVWPEMLDGKDDFWRQGEDCAYLHREFRAKMNSGNATGVDVERFKDCVSVKLSRKPLPPFNKIFACYDSLVR